MNIQEALLKKCADRIYLKSGRESWHDQIATDLNVIISCAVTRLTNCGDGYDFEFAKAVLRIADRLEEQEELERK